MPSGRRIDDDTRTRVLELAARTTPEGVPVLSVRDIAAIAHLDPRTVQRIIRAAFAQYFKQKSG